MVTRKTDNKIIPKSYFGIHVNNALPQNKHPYNAKECPLFTELGYGTIRFWDAYVVHRLVETSSGVYDWTAFDYRVNAAIAAGLDIIYTFGALPNFATAVNGPYPNYNPNPPTSPSFVTSFAQAVAERYRGKIKYYEIWNEVDSNGSWVGTIPEMVSIGQAIYPVIKAADPDAIVLSPNTISWGSLNNIIGMAYLDLYLQQASQYCDAIAMHGYTDPSQPESYISLGRAYLNLAEKYGKSSVICTETGAIKWYDSSGALRDSLVNGVGDYLPEQQAASWVTRMLLSGWLGGFDSLCYYVLDNTNHVMAINMVDYTPAGATASIKYLPALAYQYVANLLTGGLLWNYKQKGFLHTANFVSGNGKGGVVAWCSDYKTQPYDTSSSSKIEDCLGNSITPDIAYTLTNTPIFMFR